MARDVIDIAFVEVDGVEDDTITSFDVSDQDGDAEVIKTMNRRRRGIGYKKGVPEFEVTVEHVRLPDPPVDYLSLRRTGAVFPIVYEENDGGARYRLSDCRVTQVSRSTNASGEATESVTILALDHKPEG